MDLSPPQPPPPSPPSQIFHFPPLHSPGTNTNSSFPVLAIALIGIIATGVLLVSYYIFVIKCCLNWNRIDTLNRFFTRYRVNDSDNATASLASSNASPDGNATVRKGLDEAVIRAIPVIKFRKLPERRDDCNESQRIKCKNVGNGTTTATAVSYECAVCLCEFEEGEKLRVIPNCCHAFHIDCIDVWLQNNANCPICRSGICPSSILNHPQIFNYPDQYQNPSSNSSVKDDIDDNEDGYVVIEIEGNNFDDPRVISEPSSQEMREFKKVDNDSKKKKLGHVYSMGDELIESMMRKKDEEFQVQPIRRSISMDLSCDREFCIEIQEHCKKNEVSSSSSSISDCSNHKVRRSIFSFGYGRSSRGSIQPLHSDP